MLVDDVTSMFVPPTVQTGPLMEVSRPITRLLIGPSRGAGSVGVAVGVRVTVGVTVRVGVVVSVAVLVGSGVGVVVAVGASVGSDGVIPGSDRGLGVLVTVGDGVGVGVQVEVGATRGDAGMAGIASALSSSAGGSTTA